MLGFSSGDAVGLACTVAPCQACDTCDTITHPMTSRPIMDRQPSAPALVHLPLPPAPCPALLSPHCSSSPGAYNTDAYYQEKDEGFGDVGVNQVKTCTPRDDAPACLLPFDVLVLARLLDVLAAVLVFFLHGSLIGCP